MDDQQEAASLAATDLLSLKKIFLVYIYLTLMLISGRTIPEASANLLLKAGHYAVAGDPNKDYKAFKKAKPEWVSKSLGLFREHPTLEITSTAYRK